MTIGPRLISALVLAGVMALMFWLAPHSDLATFGATTPEGTVLFFSAVFAVYLIYLVVQGYPISHGQIGSASTHNLDNIISGIPALAALFGVFLHMAGFWRVSYIKAVDLRLVGEQASSTSIAKVRTEQRKLTWQTMQKPP